MSVSKVVFVEVHNELGAGVRGARLSPEAIKTAALNAGSDLFNGADKISLAANHDLLGYPTDTPHAKYIEGIYELMQRHTAALAKVFGRGEQAIVLSGDHSTALASVAAFKANNRRTRIGVIWIDAHADLHSPYTSPTGNVHGMPVAAMLGMDNIAYQRNRVERKTQEYWDLVKALGLADSKIQPLDLIMVGVRDSEPEERQIIDEWGIRHFSVEDLRNTGAGQLGRDITGMLSECDVIYVSFDVDSMDPIEVSAGTGTPVLGGLTAQEAQNLMTAIAESPKVKCVEIAEVNPLVDVENVMGEAAFQILEATYQTLMERKELV